MKNKQQQYGQFFTPDDMSKEVIDIIEKFKSIEGDVLEPSFGDGSFLRTLSGYDINIDAFEVDENIFMDYTDVNTRLNDFILDEANKKYDFIVGNPPYIELPYSFYDQETQDIITNKYKRLSNGRLNLAHIFLYKSFKQIKKDGVIAYLLPSVVLTSPYYKEIRKMIYNYFEILHIEKDTKFKGVAIKVSLLIIQKKKSENKPYFVNYNDNYYICENYKNYPENVTFFDDEGFSGSIGEIVWNQKKELLTSDDTEKILCYSTNIKRDDFIVKDKVSSDENKKQYIKNTEVKYKDCIIIPRTISKKLKFHLILDNENYIFENHVIIITHKDKDKLIWLYEKMKGNELDKYFDLFFNSSSLSISELKNLPIPKK